MSAVAMEALAGVIIAACAEQTGDTRRGFVFGIIQGVERDAYEQGRAEGRREAFAGLQFAIDGLEHIIDGDDCATCAANFSQAQYLRDAIRKLIEAEKGGATMQLVESWRLGADGEVAEHKVACSQCGTVLSPKEKGGGA